MDVLRGNENANPIERELANTVNGSIGNNDLDSDLHIRTITSDGNQMRNFAHEDQPKIPKKDCRSAFDLRDTEDLILTVSSR